MGYEYRHFVEELDIFFGGSVEGSEVWEYTKRMVRAHNEDEELAWLDFDDTLSGENVVLPLQGLVLNLLLFRDEDEDHLRALHRSVTIGRARARGLSRVEALEMHLDALEELGMRDRPFLRLVQGGL